MSVARVLAHWRQDPDLAGVRDPEHLAKLPGEEQQAWRALWEAVDALRKHGPLKGSLKAGWRLLRCHPWSRGGVDYA